MLKILHSGYFSFFKLYIKTPFTDIDISISENLKETNKKHHRDRYISIVLVKLEKLVQ